MQQAITVTDNSDKEKKSHNIKLIKHALLLYTITGTWEHK